MQKSLKTKVFLHMLPNVMIEAQENICFVRGIERCNVSYYCTIKKIDNEEITIDIKGIEIICFCNSGCNHNIGDEIVRELTFYDDLQIEETNKIESVNRIGFTYSYKIIGILDVDNKVINSCIDFHIDESDIWNVAYLDKKKVAVIVTRIDIELIL